MTPEREPERRLPLLRKAAGAQITHSWLKEVVTKNTRVRLIEFHHWNVKSNSFPIRSDHRAVLISVSLAASRRGETSLKL